MPEFSSKAIKLVKEVGCIFYSRKSLPPSVEIQDEVIYYDTCENSEELEAMDRALETSRASSCEVAQLRQKTQQLETKRGIICSRRAYLRNKKVTWSRKVFMSLWALHCYICHLSWHQKTFHVGGEGLSSPPTLFAKDAKLCLSPPHTILFKGLEL